MVNLAEAIRNYKEQAVVITKDVEKLISTNIFYTAITRAKEYLTIYWTPETGENIIEQIKNMNNTKDFYIFKNKYNL